MDMLEIINKGNLRVAQDLTHELQELIDKSKDKINVKQFCSKTRRKSIMGILSEKIKDIESIDISIRFSEDK